jgi:hypothetical protein
MEWKMNRNFVVELKVNGIRVNRTVSAPNGGTAASKASLEVGHENPRAKVDVVKAYPSLTR